MEEYVLPPVVPPGSPLLAELRADLNLISADAGGLLAGAINLGLNVKSSGAGSVGSSTYVSLHPRRRASIFRIAHPPLLLQLVFIALQAVVPFIVFFLSEPGKVIRPDGKRPRMENHQGFVAEMREMWTLVKRREVLFL